MKIFILLGIFAFVIFIYALCGAAGMRSRGEEECSTDMFGATTKKGRR